MTREEQVRAELIREVVRKTLNQLLDEEYSEIIKEIEDGNVRLSNRSMTDLISGVLLPKKEAPVEQKRTIK